ncbi:transmembrane protease serine 9-like [Trichogramma pretiosum]|uniref:transmembrane protease serine 9-like n=1 Tax=Trichogramma pretiosum TaxID=7493 RepID=UPI000C718F3E|nr:transmembrane protease serine 9-like [Trichogramma pretiosum]
MWKPFFFLFCVTFLHFVSTTEKALHLEGRIVNGDKAYSGQFPYQVSIRHTDSSLRGHFCGGIIIGDEWILTAAHCIANNGERMFAVAGDVNLAKGITREASNFHKHPNYEAGLIRNDVALLKLNQPFLFNEYINQIELNRSPDSIKPNTTCTVAGWGAKHYGSGVEESLSYVNVPLWDTKECRAELQSPHFDVDLKSNICAGYREGGKDSCQGDSGGGLLCGHTVAGIVSKGHLCAARMLPGVYTNVEHFVPWIEKIIKKNSTPPNEKHVGFFEWLSHQIKVYLRSITEFVLSAVELQRVISSPDINDSHKYTVSIQKKINEWEIYQHVCSGAIIDDFFIITAAQCFVTDDDEVYVDVAEWRVVAGTYDLNLSSKIKYIKAIMIKKNYPKKTENDIAIIELTNSFQVAKNNLTKIALPEEDKKEYTNSQAVASGFGVSKSDETTSLERNYLNVKVYASPRCTSEKLICARGIDATSKNAYHLRKGDIGGPLVFDNSLIGIYINGLPSLTTSKLQTEVFVKVSKFLDFIHKAMCIKSNETGIVKIGKDYSETLKSCYSKLFGSLKLIKIN